MNGQIALRFFERALLKEKGRVGERNVRVARIGERRKPLGLLS
jgi:hypothetical protein